MPEIARFLGMIITIFLDEHNPPNLHARYAALVVLLGPGGEEPSTAVVVTSTKLAVAAVVSPTSATTTLSPTTTTSAPSPATSYSLEMSNDGDRWYASIRDPRGHYSEVP